MKNIASRRLAGVCAFPFAALVSALVAGCGAGDDVEEVLPQLAAATGAPLATCAGLPGKFSFANTTLASAVPQAEGTLTVGGTPVGAHCLVKGEMFRRTGPLDGKSYAIGFEMRMPDAWNGRFFYQANGGTDGAIGTATGGVNGGAGLTHALKMGFAVISSDAGHTSAQNFSFGIDPQARLDYGYQAAAKLTPMAKSLIASAYGKGPDRSYFGGCSNGGRHTFVAATRLPAEYDGYLAGSPGYRLPLASIANMFGAKQYATVATNPADLNTAFTVAERTTVTKAVLAKCDALDGATDGLVQDVAACQKAFDFNRDVPTCTGARDGSCLSAAQKTAIAPIFSGATDSKGTNFYASFPFDAGLAASGVAQWEFSESVNRNALSTSHVWGTPPPDPATFVPATYALNTPIDTMLASIVATTTTYTEAGMSFMVPVQATRLSTLKNRGAKMMVYHGVSDPIFSLNDTTAWYEGVGRDTGNAAGFLRYYQVPGMGHCSGGPGTDQFDMLTPLVNWVEKGQVPDAVVATARGAGNAGGVNTELPVDWSPGRTRPLCPFPLIARYRSGDPESAGSFACKA